jgi:hypothetical protein
MKKFTLENFVHWLYTLMWSFFAAVNAMNAALCSMKDKMGLCVLALFGCAFSIVNAMSAFSRIKEKLGEENKNDYEKEP